MAHHFFGYGSLVNLATHQNAQPRKAILNGWQRVWRHVDGYDAAVLSVMQAPGRLLGVTAQVPNGDWAALDAREKGYIRTMVTLDCATQSAVYVVALHRGTQPPPILLSYLDVIAQGYAELYSEAAVAEFFDTTQGWGPILNDRAAPKYPRHQKLTQAQTALVDTHIARLGLEVIAG